MRRLRKKRDVITTFVAPQSAEKKNDHVSTAKLVLEVGTGQVESLRQHRLLNTVSPWLERWKNLFWMRTCLQRFSLFAKLL